MTMTSAEISIRVSTTLNLTLSPTPRRLITASRSMKSSATTRIGVFPPGTSMPIPSSPASRLVASRFDEVDALVIPEQITPKATRKVTKWMPNALCV